MNTIEQTELFQKWLKSVKDIIARVQIVKRIKRAENGNFGDYKSVGDGVYEMRVDIGKGYRLYYAQKGNVIYILLNGGDKATQQDDIKQAKALWAQIKKEQAQWQKPA